MAAKCPASSSWSLDSTLTAKVPDRLITGCERFDLLTITRRLGGSAETLQTAVAVMPFITAPSTDVMTFTDAANRRITDLN